MVTLNGITQRPTTDYTVSGTTLTFTTAPASGMIITVYHLTLRRAEGTVLDGTVTDSKIVSMDAAKLTGSLPSSMTVNLSKQFRAMSAVALHWASVENKVAMNLQQDFLDHFQDDTGWVADNGVSAGYQSGNRSSTITVTTTLAVALGSVQNFVNGNAPTDNSHGASDGYYWNNGTNNVAGKEVKFQWASAQTITGARVLSANSDSQGTWKWQGSNDGSSWTDIGANFDFNTASSLTFDNNFGSQLSGNSTAYTYYRMLGVSGGTNASTWWLEIEFNYPAVTNTGSEDVSRNSSGEYMSSATGGAGVYWNYASGTSQLLTASGGNQWTNSDWWEEISQADDPGSYHTVGYWLNMTTNPGFANDWFYVDYLAEYKWSGLKVAFQAYHSVVKDWRLEYSNDGTNWTVMPQTGTTTAAWTGQSFVSGHDNIATVSDAANGVFTNSNPGSGSSTGGSIITFGTAVTARYLKVAVNNIHLNLGDPTAGVYCLLYTSPSPRDRG